MGAEMMQRIVISIFLILLSLVTARSAIAADAGTVLFATGSVTAEREPAITLGKGDAVLDNDTVATGDASRAQLRMLDGAKIAIRPNSRLRIEEYLFQGAATTVADSPVVSTSGDRSVTSLIKGGFRTITGAIGKEDESAYEVRTPVGVLGIRGTDYSAVFCNGDCDWVPGVSAAAPIEDGLYLGVTEGAIFFRNEVGDIELQAGEYAFIPLVGRIPTPLTAPPPVLLDDNDLRFDADAVAQQPRPDDGSRSLTGFDSKLGTRREPDSSVPGASDDSDDNSDADLTTPAQPINALDADGTPVDITPGAPPPPTGARSISYSTGPLGQVDTIFSGTLDNDPSQYHLDAGNNVTGFAGLYPSRIGTVSADFDIDSSSNVETGFDSVTVLRWGRWAGGAATADVGAGQIDTIDLGAQSIHWVSGPESGAPVMPITGTANYSLIGATSPTDNQGNVGVLGSATFLADFTNMIVDSTLVIDINQMTWSAAGSGTIGGALNPAHVFNGIYNAVVIDGATGGTGVFSGFFSEPGPSSDPTFPGGAGLTYSLQDANGTTSVSGAAVFGNP